MYGMNHRYCQNCGHAVYSGYGQSCSGCGLGFRQMMMLDEAMDTGMWNTGGPSLGFDLTDGDPVMNMGGGIGIDLETGQPEMDIGGFDFPV